MKNTPLFLFIVLILIAGCQQTNDKKWPPVQCQLETPWTHEVDPYNPWPEYPRPQMKREEWKSLNGLWDFRITGMTYVPDSFSDKILVPYPIESCLSGIHKTLNPYQKAWYQKSFVVPEEWEGKNIILNFEAVDFETEIWVDTRYVGSHKGGYDPFGFDITKYLMPMDTHHIFMSVKDPTSRGSQARGKQVDNPGGIYYTSVTGIWQSVWIEPVNKMHIESFRVNTDIDNAELNIKLNLPVTSANTEIVVDVFEGVIKKATGNVTNSTELKLKLENPKYWSPDSPFLYDLKIKLFEEGILVDEIESYTGFRKISMEKDRNMINRLFLNNQYVFHNGPLDQGYWPDGLYTPPTEQAMKYDLEMIKAMGFNMLRKHVKVESRRYYYLCDKLGLMVWQDMPNGWGDWDADDTLNIPHSLHKYQFEKELKNMVITKYNHPSIVMWVLYNEGWGQYETSRLVDYLYSIDSTRLINSASGWTDVGVGDVFDIHHYPEPKCPKPEADRAIVLGEFGGLGFEVPNHMWETKNWGYQQMQNKQDLIQKYERFYENVWEYEKYKGLSAAVYTQITDVETETNGLITYDRKVSKIDPERLKTFNTNNFVLSPLINHTGGLFYRETFVEIDFQEKDTEVFYTLDGSTPDKSSIPYQSPIAINSDLTLKAVTIKNETKSLIVEKEFVYSDVLPPDYSAHYDPRYPGGGDYALIDGKLGSQNHADGHWQGFREDSLVVIWDMEEIKEVSKIGIGFLLKQSRWIHMPQYFDIGVSDNKAEWHYILGVSNGIGQQSADEVKRYSESTPGLKTRYIMLRVYNHKSIPEGLPGSGNQPWIFIDELQLNFEKE